MPLGIILLIFIPGYNLINLLFPNFSTKLKIDICPIFSLGLEILIMLIYYIFGVLIYGSPFFFDINFLLIIFAVISCLLILFCFYKNSNKRMESKGINTQNEKFQFNFKINKLYAILSGLFIIILVFLCLNVFSNRVSLTTLEIYAQYSENFTFFSYCDIYFYFLYFITIFLLIFFAFKLKNKIIFLTFLCLFLYVQLILPYLQIGNLFVGDAYLLQSWVHYYFSNGLTPAIRRGLTVIVHLDSNSIWPLRYATSTFYTILLMSFTNMDLLFSLSFLYPILICFIPFFVYGLFKYIFNKDKKNEKSLMVITLISIFNPFIMKLGHTLTANVIAFYVFIVIIFFFYIIFKNQELINKNVMILTFLLFFLSFTHLEEALYFLVIFLLVEFFYILFKEENLSYGEVFSDPVIQICTWQELD